MTMQTKRLNFLALAATLAVALFSSREAAAAQKCLNDIDCPQPACGGEVCSWPRQECQAAGIAAAGDTEGWCMVDSDCKCKDMGATCSSSYICTFTKPKVAATGGTSGSGGSSATGGSSGTGGSSSGTDAGTGTSKDSGGCSVVASSPSLGLGALVALGALIGIRRRRSR